MTWIQTKKTTVRRFEEGDTIQLEVCDKTGVPMSYYDINMRLGRTPKKVLAKVTDASSKTHWINTDYCGYGFPQPSHGMYSLYACRPGFPRIISTASGESPTKARCICGAHKTPNPNLHADWCDIKAAQ